MHIIYYVRSINEQKKTNSARLFNARNLTLDVMEVLKEAGPSDTFPTITGLKAVYLKGLLGSEEH